MKGSIPLSDALVLFDRKERRAVVRECLGVSSEQLSEDFRLRLSAKLGVEIRKDARWFLDYHIDWLFAAFYICSLERIKSELVIRSPEISGSITGTQEDFDLVIISNSDLILIEAKWFGSWKSAQFTSKVNRLQQLGTEASKLGVTLHFVLLSPTEPDGLQHNKNLGGWKDYAKWMVIHPPKNRDHALTVFRCRVEPDFAGKQPIKPDKDGEDKCIRRIRMVGPERMVDPEEREPDDSA